LKNMKRLSVVFLIISNFIPLFGVLFWGWSLFGILLLYWSENIIIGFFNVIRMTMAQGNDEYPMSFDSIYSNSKAGLIISFVILYGIFTSGHGFFVFKLFGPHDIPYDILVIPFIAIFISHGVSFFENYIGKEEYKKVSAQELFRQPYTRIYIMHLSILFGAFLIKAFGAPIFVLVLLIVLKTGIDLFSHFLEHKKFGTI